MKARLRDAMWAGVLLLIVLGAAPGRSPQPAHAMPITLRVGYFPNITHAQAVLGFGAGIFARELSGVAVQGTVFNAGPDELNALFAGAIDIGYIGPGPAINGYVRSGGGLYVIAGASTGGAILVARAGSPIHSVRDLAGKTVAIPQYGNTQDIELRALLADAGLKPSDSGGSVRILAVQNPDTLSLFAKGVLDAALVPEPWGSRLVKQAGARIVLDWNQIYGGAVPAAVIVVTASYFKDHPDVVVRFLRVHAQLTRLLTSSDASRTALNAQIKALTGKALPGDVLASALGRTVFGITINQAALDRFAGFSKAAGYLKPSARTAGLVNTWPLAHLNDATIR